MSVRGTFRALRAAAVLALLGLPHAPPARGEVVPLTLYQRCGRSPWVILGEVTDGDDRFAEVKVIDVLKGSYGGESLRVVHRLESFLRESWEDRIELLTGVRAVFFLKRYDPADTDGTRVPEKLQAEDMFASSFGAMGVFSLPAEGEEAYLEAVRAFSRVTAIEDPVRQEDELLGFLESPNPHILQAGLEQVRDMQLAFEEHVPVLMRLVESPRAPVRLNALQILAQVARDMRASGKSLPDGEDVVTRLKGKVVAGGSELDRAEAVKVVALLAGESERPFLERVAKEDPSQIVRYEASRAIADLGS